MELQSQGKLELVLNPNLLGLQHDYRDIRVYVKSTSKVNPETYKLIIRLRMFDRAVNIIEPTRSFFGT